MKGGIDIKRHFENSDELCEYVATLSDTILLSFSCGKDSIAAYLKCKQYFKKIELYMYDVVPDLSFVDKAVKYYEDIFETKILRMPHPSTIRMLTNGVFNPPESADFLMNDSIINKYRYNYESAEEVIRTCYHIGENVLTAIGVRAADSPLRRVSINKHGSVNEKKRTFYPIFDFRKKDVIDIIKTNNIKLPPDYRLFGRSLDGIKYLYLKPIKDYYPEDYRKILDYFPMAEAEIKRQEYKEEYFKRCKNE